MTSSDKPESQGAQGACRVCRSCGAPLERVFVDLGMSPLANSYVPAGRASAMEPFFPLKAWVCDRCLLVQLEAFETPANIFGDYAYFSSFSDSWVDHARRYVDMAAQRFGLGPSSHVVEIASNDGYLLQFVVKKGIPCLGIEPAANIAEAARAKGIPTDCRFFGTAVGREMTAAGRGADLIVGNNVLAHVPDLNDFIGGLKALLKPRGTVTMEFPHLLRLMAQNQFDTIYHEHFSYFSLIAVERAFARHGMTLFDVDELPTHGGSLRIYARHAEDASRPVGPNIGALRGREEAAGLHRPEGYAAFPAQVMETKRRLLEFLIGAKRAGKSVVGYGAPAKGNTLLNYCGVRTDFIDYTVDRAPSKQGRLLPGTRIPIHGPERIAETRPDYVLILPWNLRDEISKQMAHIRAWGGRFVVPIPQVEVLP